MHMTRRCLVVDDIIEMQALMRALLVPEGFVVTAVRTGAEALDHLTTERPDLIVLDLWLPDLSGTEVLDRLDADPALRTIPVMVCTAAAADATVHAARWEQPGRALLLKPFDIEDLLSCVERLLGQQCSDAGPAASPDPTDHSRWSPK
jgi:CheY-like chemotaxis protein